jgi:hypothetical protein
VLTCVGPRLRGQVRWFVKSRESWKAQYFVSETGLASAFRLKRPDRCPARILWVYDPSWLGWNRDCRYTKRSESRRTTIVELS